MKSVHGSALVCRSRILPRALCAAVLSLSLVAAAASGQSVPAQSESPLVTAVLKSDIPSLKKLLRSGAPVNRKDQYGCTPLMRDVMRGVYGDFRGDDIGPMAVAKLLVRAGADLNAEDKYGMTPLILAPAWDQPTLAKALIDWGADVRHRDRQGRSALTFAASRGDSDEMLVRPLLARGARVNGIEALLLNRPHAGDYFRRPSDWRALGPGRETALMLAALYGDRELVRRALSRKPNIDARDDRGFTALMQAVGATPYIGVPGGGKGWEPSGPQSGREEIVRMLLSRRPKLEVRDGVMGSTALLWAVERGQIGIVRLLVKAGANVQASDKEKNTSLSLARSLHNTEMETLLVKAGATE